MKIRAIIHTASITLLALLVVFIAASCSATPLSSQQVTLASCDAATRTLYMAAALRTSKVLTATEINAVDTYFIPVFVSVCIDRTSTDTSALDQVNSTLEAMIFNHQNKSM